MKPTVSIIIPVYNVEKYLDKCLDSVVNQTYTNLEIILVDDGSPDNCPAMCDAWMSRDSRINVIHQLNGGLSRARNAGLKIAAGEFIGFVDSDDWIEPEMFELLMTAIMETDADIAVCRYQQESVDSKGIKKVVVSSEKKLYSNEEALRLIIMGGSFIGTVVWNKLYRKSILANIRFPEGKIHEDNLWTPQIVGNSKLIVCIENSLYHYVIRKGSLSHDVRLKLKRIHDEHEMIEQRLEYVCEHYPALEKYAILKLLNFCCREYLDIALNYSFLDENGVVRQELYQYFCQYSPVIISDDDSIGKMLGRILFWIYPNLIIKIKILYNTIRILLLF